MTIGDQPSLSNGELRSLLDPYRNKYPPGYDDRLSCLVGNGSFDKEGLDRVAEWKFGRFPARLQRTRNLLANNTSRDIEGLTAKAFRCNDDLGALLLVALLDGVGKALGSAVLMAHDPARYSVIDVNAVRAIQAIGYLPDCPAPGEGDSSLPNWDRYLAAVRDVAARTGWTLRNVDRALFMAGRIKS